MIGTDPERAAREIAELETVARRSLTEVRQAVTSYRQPSLAAELVSSRRMLASAGTECRIRAPGTYSLPPAVDALLAWTVREGATNIVRHAAAKHAEIVIELTDTAASACLSDDGVSPGRQPPGMAGGASPGAVAGGAVSDPTRAGCRGQRPGRRDGRDRPGGRGGRAGRRVGAGRAGRAGGPPGGTCPRARPAAGSGCG